MGFAVATKGAPLAGLLKKFLLAAPAASALGPRSFAGACRLFNSGTPAHRGDDSFFSYPEAFALDPLLRHNVWLSKEDDPAFAFDPSVARDVWVSKEDDEVMELKVAMLDKPKEQVKLSAYPDALLVKWEGVKGSDGDEDEDPEWYSCRINLSPVAFKVDQTKAEMKNGVLKVTVPKIKAELVGEGTDIKID